MNHPAMFAPAVGVNAPPARKLTSPRIACPVSVLLKTPLVDRPPALDTTPLLEARLFSSVVISVSALVINPLLLEPAPQRNGDVM